MSLTNGQHRKEHVEVSRWLGRTWGEPRKVVESRIEHNSIKGCRWCAEEAALAKARTP